MPEAAPVISIAKYNVISIARYAEILENFFATAKIKAECGEIVTRSNFLCIDLHLAHGLKISKITGLEKEIGLALGLKTPMIRPITERQCLQLQFPLTPQKISLLDYYDSVPKPEDYNLPFLLGENDQGNPFWVDMSKNPHLLIGGATGSGKSVFLHNLIFNAFKTKNVELYLADPKQVEFQAYKNHNLVSVLAEDFQSTKNMLALLVDRMEKRFSFFASFGVNDIWQIKENFRPPAFIVILDEIGDLMLQDETKEMQNSLLRLLQKGRAAGIYIITATQRPSVNIISGILKANLPARLSFRVGSKIDSQVILDEPGAENLVGSGDALFRNAMVPITRLQVAFADVKMNMEICDE